MSKKVMWIIAAIIVIAVVAAGVYYFVVVNNKGTKVDITTVSESMANTSPFNELATMDIDNQILSSLYQIDETLVEEVKGKMPMMNVQASMYVLINAKDGKVEDVKAKIEDYGKSYEEQWSTYLPDQHELVKNRKVGVKGNLVYMIIAENAAEIEKLIK